MMATKKASAKKSASKKRSTSSSETYTRPALRERIKKRILAGDKGGHPGQWSARKAQMVTNEYEAKGGGYKQERNRSQRSLKKWGEENWRTSGGKQAIQGEVTHRYLPDAAWKELSPGKKKATERKKVAASKRGKQYVANTRAAAGARKRASAKKRSR